MLQVERERESAQSLTHDEQVYMAGLALAGWTFTLKDWSNTDDPYSSWEGRGGNGHCLHAPTLFSLLGYIERVLADEAAQKLLPDAAKTRPGAPGKN